MVKLQKTVLMLLERNFQARVWRAALTSQNISVIGGLSDVHVAEILEQLQQAKIQFPNLLLTDLEIRNPYDLCRWCRRYYPSLKIVLVSNNQRNISSTERRWTIHQGADELLPGFPREDLLSNAITEVGKVLEILECPPLQENTLIPAMLSFCRESTRLLNLKSAAPKMSTFALDVGDYISASQTKRDKYPSDRLILSPENRPFTLPEPELRTSLVNFSTNSQSSSASTLSLTFLWLATILSLLSLLLITLMWRFKLHTSSPQQPKTAIVQSESKSAATLQDVKGVPTGIYNYHGSTTWSSILKLVNPKVEQVFPELKLRYAHSLGYQPGSGTGIQMLLDGELDFTLTSRPLTAEEYTSAHRRGFGLTQHIVAIDGIAVAVNHSLAFNNITINQLKQIYLGEVTNWSQLGGTDLNIVPLARATESSGTSKFFQQAILANKKLSSRVNLVYSTTIALREVNSKPGGIYFASASEIVPQCTVKPLALGFNSQNFISPAQKQIIAPEQCPQQRNSVNIKAFRNSTYPLTRNLYVIVKRNGEREEKIGKAYVKLLLSKQGQKLVQQAGFVPIQ